MRSLDCRHEKCEYWGVHRSHRRRCTRPRTSTRSAATTCRPLDQWPELLFDLPELQYPDRLNCAVELLDAVDRPARAGPAVPADPGRRPLDLRRAARAVQPDRRRSWSSELGVVPGNRVLLRGAEQPVAGRRAGSPCSRPAPSWSPPCRCCARASSTTVAEIARRRPRAVRPPVHRRPAAAAILGGAPIVAYGGDGRTDRVAPQTEPTTFAGVDTAADDVALLAFTSGTTGRPKATMHFHRDVLAIADTFSQHLVLSPSPDDVFTGTPPLAFTFGLGGLRGLPAARRRVDAADREGDAGRARRPHRASTGSRSASPHRRRTARCCAPGRAGSLSQRCAGRCRPASTCPRRPGRRFHDATGVRAHRRHRLDRDAAHLHRPPPTTTSGRARPAGRCRATGPRSSTTRATRSPPGTPGRLAVKGPTGCRYLADDRQAVVRPGRLEHHRRHLRPGRGRLLLVPGAQRRHDHLVRLQHRRPEVEEALTGPPGRAGVRRRRASRTRTRGQLVTAFVVLRRRRRRRRRRWSPKLQDFVKQQHRAVQVPARDRVRRRAAADHDRQAAALRAAPGSPREAMRIAVIGGGPGGLYFAALAKQLSPDHEITVWERNAADDTFGFGVVFSDETLGGIEHADPCDLPADGAGVRPLGRHRRALPRPGDHQRRARLRRDEPQAAAGDPAGALPRPRRRRALLRPTRRTSRRSRDATTSSSPPTASTPPSATGTPTSFRPTLDDPALQVHVARHRQGLRRLQVRRPRDAVRRHADPRLPVRRARQHVHRRDARGGLAAAGFDAFAAQAFAPASPTRSRSRGSGSCSPTSSTATEVMANNSKWISFTTVRNERWRHGNVVLLGDAAHTAHFSIGSGTKLAMEDALALAACLHEQPTVDAALGAYEAERRPVVLSTQRAAQASLEWFENLGQYVDQDPVQFAFNIMTRSRRVTYDNLRLRDPEFVDAVDAWFAATSRRAATAPATSRPPMFQPFRLRRARAGQPGRRVADGHVPGERRRARRLPPRPPRRQGARRGRAGDDRDGLRVRHRPDHPRLHRPLDRRAGRALAPGHRLRARRDRREDRHPARPLRPQGLDQADVGGHRPAAARRQLGGRRAVAAALPRRRQPGAARADPTPTWPRSGSSSSRPPGAPRRRLRPARAALRARLPAVVVHLAAHQPAHRRVRRSLDNRLRYPARGVHRDARGLARRTSR